MDDQRTYLRFDVRTRCILSGETMDGIEGVTHNISRGGVLIQLQSRDDEITLPKLGDQTTIDIELAENHRFGPKSLRCTGTVVRILNARRSEPRIAFSISQMEFKDRVGGKRGSVKRKDFALLFGGGRHATTSA